MILVVPAVIGVPSGTCTPEVVVFTEVLVVDAIPDIPAVPVPTATEQRVWERTVDDYVKRTMSLRCNLQNLYSLVWGQCEQALQDKIEAMQTYTMLEDNLDSIGLLKAIQKITFRFKS